LRQKRPEWHRNPGFIQETTMDEFEEYCREHFGFKSEVAKAAGIRPQAVFLWQRAWRIPADKVLIIERLSNGELSRHRMRPDVFGPEPC
jgi:DNA-binding transcriptional regulator YdaS (Cro superfamily)